MLRNNRNRVYVDFPKVGLGNMLLIWARAIVFCKINNLELTTSSWWGFRWGALLRRESKKRLYYNYFIEANILDRIYFKLRKLNSCLIYDPELTLQSINNNLYIFNKVNINGDLFHGIRDHKIYIKVKLEEILHPRIKNILSNEMISDIAIHVRRGDFKNGNPITPLSHFIKGIELVRAISNKSLSVSVFSDADEEELSELLILDNVRMANSLPDIADILLMSKSKILFLSQSSSFSYWAAFLSDSLVIMHSNDWQNNIAKNATYNNYKELRWNQNEEIPADLVYKALNLK